jgi:hypothetical protein
VLTAVIVENQSLTLTLLVYDVTLKLPQMRGYTDAEVAAGGNVEVSAKMIGQPGYVKK